MTDPNEPHPPADPNEEHGQHLEPEAQEEQFESESAEEYSESETEGEYEYEEVPDENPESGEEQAEATGEVQEMETAGESSEPGQGALPTSRSVKPVPYGPSHRVFVSSSSAPPETPTRDASDKSRRRRRRRVVKKREAYVEPPPPVIDPVAVKGWLSSLGEKWAVPAIWLILAGVVVLVFGRTLSADFMHPGDSFLSPTGPLFTTPALHSVVHAFEPSRATGPYYAPLTTISFIVDRVLYGEWAGGYHLTNVLLHLAATLLLFAGLRQTTGATWRSALVAAAFAVHPLHVESVAWIAERHSVLGGFFLALLLPAYVRLVNQPWSALNYGVILGLSLACMLADPALIGLPILLVAIDFWPLGRLSRPQSADAGTPYTNSIQSPLLRLAAEKIPLFAISAMVLVLTLMVQARMKSEAGPAPFAIPGNLAASQAPYLLRTLFMAPFVPFHTLATGESSTGLALLGMVLIGCAGVAAFLFRGRCPYLLTGWLCYTALLAPGILWQGWNLPTDFVRYAYVARIGLYIMIAWGAWDLCAMLPWRRTIAAVALAGAATAMIFVASTGAVYWHDDEALWRHIADADPDNYLAQNYLGTALEQSGELKLAVEHFKKAQDLRPDDATAFYNMGNTLVLQGHLQEAVAQYKKALEIRPSYPAAFIGLGIALNKSATPDEAIPYLQKALELSPQSAEAWLNLGISAAVKNDPDGAIANYDKALQLQPRFAEADFYSGVEHAKKGDFTTAISFYNKALEAKPTYHEAYYNLGVAYYRTGNTDVALANWKKAIELHGNYEEAHYNLAIVLAQRGDLDEAIAHYKKALEIGPNYAEIYNNLGSAYLLKKQYGDAVANFDKAVQIAPGFVLARNNLAMTLASCSDKTYRDGARAVDLILDPSKVVAGGKDPILLRTLAAAYAESGRFPDALQTAKRALEYCTDNPALAEKLRQEIKLYESGKPYRELVKPTADASSPQP